MWPSSVKSTQFADMFKALGEPIRLRIVEALWDGPKNVGELADALEVEVVTVSHHLGVLHAAGLLGREKRGRYKVYRLRDGILLAASRRGKQEIDLGCCRFAIPAARRRLARKSPSITRVRRSRTVEQGPARSKHKSARRPG